MRPDTFSFAVYPYPDGAATFDPFILDVPSMIGPDAASRRAWWSAFTLLGPQGVEPEEFTVHVWADGADGPKVGPGGIVPSTAWKD